MEYKIPLTRAHECAIETWADVRPLTICVETDAYPHSARSPFSSGIDSMYLTGEKMRLLIARLNSAPLKVLAGQELYDSIDHATLLTINEMCNGIRALPTRVWIA